MTVLSVDDLRVGYTSTVAGNIDHLSQGLGRIVR